MTSRCLDVSISIRSLVNQSNCSNLHRPRATCRTPRAFDRWRTARRASERERTRASRSRRVASSVRHVCGHARERGGGGPPRRRWEGTTTTTIRCASSVDETTRERASDGERGVRTTGRELGRRVQFVVVVIRKVLVADAVATRRVAGEDVSVSISSVDIRKRGGRRERNERYIHARVVGGRKCGRSG